MIDRATFQKQGICRRIKAGGSLWEGMFLNDKLNGFGRYVDGKGEIVYYLGMWKEDQFDGYGKCVNTDKSYYKGMWRNGRKEGHGKFVTAQGQIEEGHWIAGKF